MRTFLTDIQAIAALLAVLSAAVMVIGMMATSQPPTGWPRWLWRSMIVCGLVSIALRVVILAMGGAA